jgi:hypothetical protein
MSLFTKLLTKHTCKAAHAYLHSCTLTLHLHTCIPSNLQSCINRQTFYMHTFPHSCVPSNMHTLLLVCLHSYTYFRSLLPSYLPSHLPYYRPNFLPSLSSYLATFLIPTSCLLSTFLPSYLLIFLHSYLPIFLHSYPYV